jgi:hypothetical protein
MVFTSLNLANLFFSPCRKRPSALSPAPNIDDQGWLCSNVPELHDGSVVPPGTGFHFVNYGGAVLTRLYVPENGKLQNRRANYHVAKYKPAKAFQLQYVLLVVTIRSEFCYAEMSRLC